ncbi:unnamed protein product, partial [Effrenium voratum]
MVHAPLGPSTLMPGKDMLEKDNGLVTLPEDPVEQEADQIFAQRVAVAKAKVQPTALVRQSSGLLVEASTSLPFQVALRRDQVGAPAQVIARYFRHARSVNTMPIMDLPGGPKGKVASWHAMVHLARAQSAGAWCSFLEEHKAVPYEFGAKTQSDPHAGFKDVYFGANEPWGETLHDIFTLIAHKFTQVEHYVSVVGSMNALNFLTAIRPKQIHFFDLNPAAVSWGKLLVELVRASASPQDFVSRLFARDLQGFEAEGQVLSPASQEAFLQLPPSEAIRSETLAKLSEESQDVYRQVAEQVEGHKHDLNTGGLESGSFAGLFPAWDRAFAGPLTKSGLGPRMGARRSFLYGEGFLRSQWTFDQVKQVLEETPISWTSGVDFPHAFPADLLPKGSMRGATLLYAMDMWSGPSHHAARWPADRIRAWQEESGDGGLVVVQSKGDRSELVQKLVPASGGG